MALGKSFLLLIVFQPGLGLVYFLSPFSDICYIRLLNRRVGEEGEAGVARQEGKPEEQRGGGAGVRSPARSASGEAVEPEIEAEAKIGTYKSVELGSKPAGRPGAQLGQGAGGPRAPSPLLPHTCWDQNQAGPRKQSMPGLSLCREIRPREAEMKSNVSDCG